MQSTAPVLNLKATNAALKAHFELKPSCTVIFLLLDCVGPKATSTAVSAFAKLLKTLPQQRDDYLVIGHVDVPDVSRSRFPGHTRGDAREGQAAFILVYSTKRPDDFGWDYGAGFPNNIIGRGCNFPRVAFDFQWHLAGV
ncbi:MAG: hypothetical protein WCF66_04335 [Pseudolabrys sp.]